MKLRALSPSANMYQNARSPLSGIRSSSGSRHDAAASPLPRCGSMKVFKPQVFARKTQQFIDHRQGSSSSRGMYSHFDFFNLYFLGNISISAAREKLKSARHGTALQLLEPTEPTNTSYQQIQRMEERIQSIENLAKRSLIAKEKVQDEDV